ncbi:MAG TPA: hypothetical protein VFW96_24455, partial [Thermomicrobiales bacterium]|nr:hypothetical protein [Thermomicrobiales bacterium]
RSEVMGAQTPENWEAKLRLELWRLGEESKRLFDDLPSADPRRLSEILDELQIAQSRINDKIMALRAVLSVK